VGALIIEPEAATGPRMSPAAPLPPVKFLGGADFRGFVVIDQNMVANRRRQIVFWPVSREAQSAINYRSEPFGIRGAPSNAQTFRQPAPQGYGASLLQ